MTKQQRARPNARGSRTDRTDDPLTWSTRSDEVPVPPRAEPTMQSQACKPSRQGVPPRPVPQQTASASRLPASEPQVGMRTDADFTWSCPKEVSTRIQVSFVDGMKQDWYVMMSEHATRAEVRAKARNSVELR
jgi:hypothetical protein